MAKKQTESYSEKEAAQRRDAALLRALNTPPKPKAAKVASGGLKKKK